MTGFEEGPKWYEDYYEKEQSGEGERGKERYTGPLSALCGGGTKLCVYLCSLDGFPQRLGEEVLFIFVHFVGS